MTLTKEQLMERNLDLAEEHLLHVLRHPEVLEHIPDEAHVVLLPTNDPDVFDANLQMAIELAREMRNSNLQKPAVLVLMPMKGAEPVLNRYPE